MMAATGAAAVFGSGGSGALFGARAGGRCRTAACTECGKQFADIAGLTFWACRSGFAQAFLQVAERMITVLAVVFVNWHGISSIDQDLCL